MSRTLNPETVERILSADLRNILAKVAAGKALTPGEHARVVARAAASSGSVDRVKTILDLAKALGTGRRQITRWQKMEGAPEPVEDGYDVVAWREFVRVRGLKAANVTTGVDWDALKARKVLAEIEDRELRVAVRKHRYFPVDVVREEWTGRVARAVSLMRSKFENELPPVLAGLDAAGIRQECAAAVDEICRTLNEGTADRRRPG